MKRDISYYPDPEGITQKIGESSRFNTMPVTEGMKAAINLRSWDANVIDMILEIFTERASNNYISFEYQLTNRAPKMLLSRFNVWEHKPSQKWIVLSMPSSVFRTDDPLLSKETEKIKGDGKMSRWLAHKSGNVNYIGKFKSPRMTDYEDKMFKIFRKEAKIEYEKGKTTKKSMTNVWYGKLAEFWQQIQDGEMSYIDLPEELRKKHAFNDSQVAAFLREFDKYDRNWKLTHPREKVEQDEL